MPASKAEQVLEALRTLLATVPGAAVERNSVLPEKIPSLWFERASAYEARDDLRAGGDRQLRPYALQPLQSRQRAGLIDDTVLGQGRDPLASLQDVITNEGDIVVPVDPRYLGLWLTGLFGDPDTTDNLDGSWDHEFASGDDDLPSYTLEVGMPKVPAFFVHAGV
jgi:hypothetical protein